MKTIQSALLCAVLVAATSFYINPRKDAGKVYQYINGNWFNGQSFEQKTMYVHSGFFLETAPATIDSVIDLGNQFVIPPFGEAHTHMLEGIGNVDERINNYLKHGVFYVKNPNNVREWTRSLFGKLNKPTSVDGSFANGGITSTGGHPQILYEEVIIQHLKGAIPDIEKSWFRNKAFFNANSEQELQAIWPVIMADKPDFIKAYLANSEEFGKAQAPSKYVLRKGLDPKLLKAIVAKAHSAGLRVSAHVETAADFRSALDARVDEINHTPGFYIFSSDVASRYELTASDAKRAANQRTTVVTTLLSRDLIEDRSLLPLAKSIQAKNLQLLHKHGVAIAIGSDHSDLPVHEMNALMELKIFDNLTLLKMWTENTAATIFPKRKIGHLKPGYEASFLVLKNNPLHSFTSKPDIAMMIKQGRVLRVR
ncbi:MAG TPA: amidohydrolase family protein [Chitinophagaceae bacterium]|nr:amidohydrolase family protein [Chitinophagaceae bacterium]